MFPQPALITPCPCLPRCAQRPPMLAQVKKVVVQAFLSKLKSALEVAKKTADAAKEMVTDKVADLSEGVMGKVGGAAAMLPPGAAGMVQGGAAGAMGMIPGASGLAGALPGLPGAGGGSRALGEAYELLPTAEPNVNAHGLPAAGLAAAPSAAEAAAAGRTGPVGALGGALDAVGGVQGAMGAASAVASGAAALPGAAAKVGSQLGSLAAALDPGQPRALKPFDVYRIYANGDQGLDFNGFCGLLDNLGIKMLTDKRQELFARFTNKGGCWGCACGGVHIGRGGLRSGS
eukprot:359985-Chlamydomonas_euryale.AAC.3